MMGGWVGGYGRVRSVGGCMGKSVPGWPGVERAAERFALGGPAAAVAGGTAPRVQWWEPVPDPPVGIADSSEFE